MDTIICGYLAKFLGMRRPGDGPKKMNQAYLANELNELSSKSLLANVLDINDEFGVVNGNSNNKNSLLNRNLSSRNKSKFFSDQYVSNSNTFNNTYQANQPILLKRENSSLSHSGIETLNDNMFSPTNKTDANLVRKNLTSILKEIRVITQKLKDDEEDEGRSLNWKFAAMVIDRLCLVVLSTATILSAVLILFTSKNIFKPSDPSPIF